MIKRIGHDSKVGCVLQINRRDHFPLDCSAFNQKLINNGSAWNLDGRYFNGLDNYVNAGNDASLNSTDAITIEVWVNPAVLPAGDSGHKMIVANGLDTDYLSLYTSSGNPFLSLKIAGAVIAVNSNFNISINTWYHVVGTFDGTIMEIYVNGLLKNTSNAPGTLDSRTTNTYIGKYVSDSFYFNGSIDEVRIYNRALSPAEITQLYLRRKPCLGA